MCYGKEVGESGTPHIQGVVVFKSQMTDTSVRKKLKGAHVEACKGRLDQNQTYCKKDGDWIEKGVAPMSRQEQGQASKDYYENLAAMARDDKIMELPAEARAKHWQWLKTERDYFSKKRKLDDTEETHLWYYGESKTGKSRKAREDHPDAYLKMCNKWWDGYDNEETVLIEDLDAKHDKMCHHLKLWADRYPYLAEYKGGAKKIRPKLIIVTSNFHPGDIWSDPRDLEPIKRRFKIVRFGGFAQHTDPSPFVDDFTPAN